MGLIKIIEKRVITVRFKRRGKRQLIALWACDQCCSNFEFPFVQGTQNKKHFCSKNCHNKSRQKGQKLYGQIVETNQKRYGAKFASMTELTKEKTRQTNLIVYGVNASSQNEVVESKRKQTCIKLYGGFGATSASFVRQKVLTTIHQKYGGGVLLDPVIRAKFNATMTLNHSASWSSQSTQIFEKQKETNFLKYGVVHPFHTEQAKKNTQSVEAKRKRHQTKKLNGTYAMQRSKIEIQFVTWLRTLWIVDESVLVDRWEIDAYIHNINTYVQFDGVYWHGLDRDLTIIEQKLHPTDVSILGTIARDKVQNDWFKQQNISLIRIKDVDFKKLDLSERPTLQKLYEICYFRSKECLL